MNKCKYCSEVHEADADWCAKNHSSGYVCTRRKGHKGIHVACTWSSLGDDHETLVKWFVRKEIADEHVQSSGVVSSKKQRKDHT